MSFGSSAARQNNGMKSDESNNPKSIRVGKLTGPRRFFVSRHPGAIAWAKQYHWAVRAQFVTHLDIEHIAPGDTVIGTLPVHMAAQVCARGARYLHLSIELAAEQRGSEMTADQLDAAGACLVPYRIVVEAGISQG